METKYSEALEKAKVWYKELKDSGYIHDSNQLEKIFPELAESEEEKIRKDLIEFVNQYGDKFYGTIAKAYAISWLEKQKPVKLNEEDEKVRKALIKYLDALDDDEIRYGVSFKDMCAWLEKQKKRSGLTKDEEFTLNRIIEHFEEEGGYDKWIEVLQDIRNIPYQKEQKPVEWSEEDEKMLNNCIGLLLEIDSTKEERDWLLNLKPQLKYEWTKEDTDHLNSIIGTIVYCKSECPTDKLCQDIYNSDIEWLESLRPQLKQEWSEEDENIRKELIRHCSGPHELYDERNWDKWLNWLKSIKDGVQPQPKQELSEEYIEELVRVYSDNLPCGEFESYAKALTDAFRQGINAVKSLKPQHKQEWSEQDEECRNALINICSYPHDEMDGRPWKKWADWLKSLKPQQHWKPSKAKSETKNKCPNYSEGYGCSTSPLKQCDICPDYKLYNHWKPSDIEVKELQRVISEFGFDHNDVLKQLLDELKTLRD